MRTLFRAVLEEVYEPRTTEPIQASAEVKCPRDHINITVTMSPSGLHRHFIHCIPRCIPRLPDVHQLIFGTTIHRDYLLWWASRQTAPAITTVQEASLLQKGYTKTTTLQMSSTTSALISSNITSSRFTTTGVTCVGCSSLREVVPHVVIERQALSHAAGVILRLGDILISRCI